MENPIKMDDLRGKTPYFRKHPFGIHPTPVALASGFSTRPGGCRCTDKADSQVRIDLGDGFLLVADFSVLYVNIYIFTYIVGILT